MDREIEVVLVVNCFKGITLILPSSPFSLLSLEVTKNNTITVKIVRILPIVAVIALMTVGFTSDYSSKSGSPIASHSSLFRTTFISHCSFS